MKSQYFTGEVKNIEVFDEDGHSVYKWEPVEADDTPNLIVVSKTGRLLWGDGTLEALGGPDIFGRFGEPVPYDLHSGLAADHSFRQEIVQVVRLSGADRVVAVWKDGMISVDADDEDRVYIPGEGWKDHWNSSDQQPEEIDEEIDSERAK